MCFRVSGVGPGTGQYWGQARTGEGKDEGRDRTGQGGRVGMGEGLKQARGRAGNNNGVGVNICTRRVAVNKVARWISMFTVVRSCGGRPSRTLCQPYDPAAATAAAIRVRQSASQPASQQPAMRGVG